jgi:hypothetical protein
MSITERDRPIVSCNHPSNQPTSVPCLSVKGDERKVGNKKKGEETAPELAKRERERGPYGVEVGLAVDQEVDHRHLAVARGRVQGRPTHPVRLWCVCVGARVLAVRQAQSAGERCQPAGHHVGGGGGVRC